MKKNTLLIYALFSSFLFTFSNCKEKPKSTPVIINYSGKKELKKEDDLPSEIKIFPADTSLKYKFKSGSPGNYQYHYEVVGTNEKKENVFGEIDVHGKFGTGVIEDETNRKIKVEVEWIGKNQLKAEDSEGNIWKLKVK